MSEDDELTVQVCVTRTLPPALTLEVGLERVMEAVDELKTDPPKSSSGVLRFQVLHMCLSGFLAKYCFPHYRL